jgi:hypothetical protein
VYTKTIQIVLENERKEYLYYYENWTGKNWLAIPIALVTDHVEGMYYEQLKELKLDPITGDALEYVRKGQREAYYIPFSKKTVDDIIAGSMGSNLQTIKYIVKFAPEDSPDGQRRSDSRGQFSYEQLATWAFDDLYKLHIKPWKDMIPNVDPTTRMYK